MQPVSRQLNIYGLSPQKGNAAFITIGARGSEFKLIMATQPPKLLIILHGTNGAKINGLIEQLYIGFTTKIQCGLISQIFKSEVFVPKNSDAG